MEKITVETKSIDGRTDLHIILNSTLTAQKHVTDIFRLHILSYFAMIGDFCILIHSIGGPHAIRLAENMVETEAIGRMEYPTCSGHTEKIALLVLNQ